MSTDKAVHRRRPVPGAGVASVAVLAALMLWAAGDRVAGQDAARQQIGTLRIGILAEPGADASVQRLADLKKAYTMAVGVPVEFFVARDYRTLIEAQGEKRIDYAIYSATAYATAELACGCVSPLVAPTAASGALGMRSVLIARSGSVTTIADMSKYRVAITGGDDIAGFQLPLFSLRREGMALTGEEPFFVRAASLEAAETMLMTGEVDAIFGWAKTGISKTPLTGSGTLQRLAQAGSDEARFGIVWSSDLLRYGPHAISKDLDPAVRRRLVPFLSGLKDSDPDLFEALARHQLGGFVSVDQTDYATVVDLVREASGAGQ